MFDQRYYKKCSSSDEHKMKSTVPSVAPTSIETLVEAELISLQSDTAEKEHDTENEEFYASDANDKHVRMINGKVNNNEGDGDDTFYDKFENNKMDSFTAVSLIASH